MTNQEFSAKLAQANTPLLLARLAESVIEESLAKEDNLPALQDFVDRIRLLLDADLDPNIIVDETFCVDGLQYGYTDYHLDAAKMIFDRCGLPHAETEDGDESFFSWIRSKVDYNYYNCEFMVKLYLLCCAYTTEETYLQFNQNLCREMFDPRACYTSGNEACTPLQLTAEIFKEIHRFDFSVEMLPQETGHYGCWRLHIFDRESRIEVATYE